MSKHKDVNVTSSFADWSNIAVALLARIVLLTVATGMLWALIPALFGWHVTTTMSGSMEPKVMTGDVVVSMPYDGDKVKPGQVILSPDPDKPDRLRFHRVDSVGENATVITKGDANQNADSDPIKRSDIIGVGVIRVPYLGIPSLWMNTGQWLPFGLVVLSTPLLLWLSGRDRKLLRAFKEAQHKDGVKPSIGAVILKSLPQGLQKHQESLKPVITIGLVLVLAVSTFVIKPSGATFTSSANSSNNLTTKTDFGCLDYGFSTLGVSLWNFNENPTGTYATKAKDKGDQFGDLTLVGATKKTGSCYTTDPYVTMNGSTSIMYGPNQAQANASALSGYIRTSVKSRAMTIGTLSGAAGTASSANSGSSLILYLDANGKLNVGTRYSKYSYVGTQPVGSQQACMKLTYTATTNALNDGKWHTVSGSLFRNTNGTNIRMYVDGVVQNYNIPDTEQGATVDSLNSYVKWGYEPGMNACMSGAVGTNPSRWSGDLDDLFAGRTTSTAPDSNHK